MDGVELVVSDCVGRCWASVYSEVGLVVGDGVGVVGSDGVGLVVGHVLDLLMEVE